MEKRHRVFIAINLPVEVKRELASYYEKWPELPAKWTPKDNLHITLEFLGDLTDVEVGEACIIVKEVAERHNSFTINLNKVLYGPPRLRSGQAPRLVWAEGEKSEELAELREDLQESLLEKIAFRSDEIRRDLPSTTFAPNSLHNEKLFLANNHPNSAEHLKRKSGAGFTPHITLARIIEWEFRKFDLDERPEINEEIDLPFTVESIEVMESELKRGGPQYIILESHQLK